MRKRETRRAQTDHQHLVSGGGLRVRAGEIQRIPARQQAVNLKAPGQLQHIFQRSRFDLRDIDGLLLLKNAGFHAVVADAVPRSGAHRIIDGDNG